MGNKYYYMWRSLEWAELRLRYSGWGMHSYEYSLADTEKMLYIILHIVTLYGYQCVM